MQFKASRTVLRRDSREHELPRVVSFRISKVGGKLLVDYGEKFMF